MVYADPPADPPAGIHRINDLSLKVTAPNGITYYWGKNGLDVGIWSTSGGSSNTIDTVENVFIQDPVVGCWTIEVLADEVVEDGHVETDPFDADYALIVSAGSGLPTVGNTQKFLCTSSTGNRRAMPFNMPENGNICSVTMYHNGGTGSMILGVYGGESTPQKLLGVTASTAVSSSSGWQTIKLKRPAYVDGGTTVWLAWVYQYNPGIAYQTGSPGRFQSPQSWEGGMPDPFGSGSQANFIYSIYASYVPVGDPPSKRVGKPTIFGNTSTNNNRRAMPFTMPENGTIESVTMYHTGGSGSMILGVYDGEGAPQNRLGVTATTTVSGSTGWQTIDLTSPAFVAGGSTVWLAWVYESNPGIAYQTGTPDRADAGVGWSGGMPDPFGSSTTASYLYSIYATYTVD
jgi:hypothetical protein